jgi:hypothetical protein
VQAAGQDPGHPHGAGAGAAGQSGPAAPLPDADGGAVAAVGFEQDYGPGVRTLEDVRATLEGRIARQAQEDAAREATRRAEAADRERLRPLYERAMSRVPLAARTGRPDRGKAAEVEAAYRCACEGYDDDRRHWERVLSRLAGEAVTA